MNNINWTLVLGIIGAADGAILAGASYLSTSSVCTGTCQSTTQALIGILGSIGTILGTTHVVKTQRLIGKSAAPSSSSTPASN